MAAILYHMTLKLLGQIKVNKMYLCINFHPFIFILLRRYCTLEYFT